MQKRKSKELKYLLIAVISLALLCGCQNRESAPATAVSEEPKQETVQSDYEVEMEQREGFVGEEAYEQSFIRPQVNSNIFVDLMGYAPEDQKYAYFAGSDLAESFYVIDSATGERIFTGKLKKMGNEMSEGKQIYKGDFSDITEPGVYYIQTAVIGQSYTFRIDPDRYRNQYEELKKEFLTLTPEEYFGEYDTPQERSALYYSFQKFAMAYYFFPEALGEEYEQKLEEYAQWILLVREEVLAQREERKRTEARKPNYNEPGEDEKQLVTEDYMFASAAAAATTILRPYNPQLSSRCLAQAQKAYQDNVKYKLTGDVQYMAAGSLFCATGSYTYHAVIKEKYAQQPVAKPGYTELSDDAKLLCDEVLWGNLYYLISPKGADMAICDKQMAEMMNLCGEWLDKVPKSAFGLIENREDSLEKAIWLTVADYTIVSREYRNVCKEQIHSVLHKMEEIGFTHEQKATLLLLLGNLAESEEEE